MAQFFALVQSLLILVALILCAFWLKSRGIISSEDRSLFSRLVTDFALPALITVNLARHPFDLRNLLPAAILLGSTVFSLFLGWMIGQALGLGAAKLGAFVLVSGFGSSASLGYALVHQIMGNNPEAMSDALIIGEFGATTPFFIIGVAIAVYFGGEGSSTNSRWAASMSFFRSPIFISLALGIVWSFWQLPETNPAVRFMYTLLDTIGNSLVVLVAMSIGLMLKPILVKQLLPPILAIMIIKLMVEPLLVFAGTRVFGLMNLVTSVLVIEAAMPSGTVATVVGARYGVDGALASALTIATYVVSLVTLPLMFLLTT
jgi:malate permease and related proteins